MKKTMQKMLLALLMSCTSLLLWAQQRTVTGTVMDDQGVPIPHVSYIVKGTATGGVSDEEGNFSASINSNNSILEFTAVGYTKKEVAVGNNTTLSVVLTRADATAMETVVITTALGIKKENRSVGYGISQLKGDEVAKLNVINPVQALQGQIPGVSVVTSDGGLFGNSKIQLRGVASLNSKNNQPIFVIDGVILENGISNASADWSGSADDYGNILKNLNPDDFKSLSILRGAAATALYGSRGINGAIIIETKDGKGSKGLGISARYTLGIDDVYSTPDMQYDYGEGTLAGYVNYGTKTADGKYYPFDVNQFYLNSDGIPTKIGASGLGWGPKFDGRKIIDYDGTETTYIPYKNNVLDAYNTGFNNTVSIALSGGNEKGNFYLSDAYTRRTGMFPKNAFDRNALQFTGSYNLAKWFRADASISFTTSIAKNPRNNLTEPFLSGTWLNYYDTKKYSQQQYWQAKHGGVPSSQFGDPNANVPGNGTWFSYNLNSNEQREYVTRPVVRLTADITNWLTLMAEGNMNYYTTKYEGKALGQGYENDGGSYELKHFEDVSKTGKLNLTIKRNIVPDISANVILGGEIWQQNKSETRTRTDGGLIVPGKYFLGNSKQNVIGTGRNFGNKQINSLYFITDFAYKNELFLSITGRNDWSSALVYTNGTGNYSYFYPSASLSWIANETFQMPSWISYAKLRASVAQVGGDTEPFFINNGYETGKFELSGNKFIYTNGVATTLVNEGILPERKNSIELGANVQFLKNRVGFDFSFYRDVIRNQIGSIPVPNESGIKDLLTNIGTLKNTGIELTLNATPVKNSNFKWNSTFNYWRNNSKILELDENYGEYKTLGGYTNYGNFRIGSVAFVGGEYGVLMSDSKPLTVTDAKDRNFGKKILTWSDSRRGAYYTRSGKVEEVGKIQPDFEGSWINSFSYKNIEFSFQLDGRFGGNMASFSSRYGTAYGYLAASLKGRDANNGGLGWTSDYTSTKGQTFADGVIPDGVFKEGQMVTSPSGEQVNVGGMTYMEAYEKGYVEPTHASFYTYFNNSWGTGVVNPDWFSEVKYVSLRNISLSYTLPKKWFSKSPVKNLTVGANVRNVAFLYNSLPNNINPESFRGTTSSESFLERNFIPYTRNYTISVAVNF